MATWTNATVTNKGYALQAKLLSTDKLDITRVVSGSGRATAGQLVNQTAVSNIQQTLTVESLTYDDNGNATLRVLLSNENLAASYVCNQIGIYANDPDEGEILYAIVQESTVGLPIPSITEQPLGYNCGWFFTLTYSNSSNIDVTIDPTNAVTIEAGDARYLKQADAEQSYLKKTAAGDTYLSKTDAASTYLSKTDAETTYFKKADTTLRSFGSVKDVINKLYVTEDMSESNVFGVPITMVEPEEITQLAELSNGAIVQTILGFGSLQLTYNLLDDDISYGAQIAPYALALGKDYEYADDTMFMFIQGLGLKAGRLQTVIGRYNDHSTAAKKGVSSETSTTGSLFVVGMGKSDSSRANAFRVQANGAVYGGSAYNSTNADTAYLREWLDGNPNNEDRIGYFVVLDGEKIRKATADDDDIFGIVSDGDIASFIANNYADSWHGRWLKDVFGRRIIEAVQVEAYTDDKGVEHPARTDYQLKENPAYDPTQIYIPREERPEWDVISIFGENVINDDGTCQVNGYAKPNNDGIATAAEGKTAFRVLKRIDESHVLIFHK